MPLSYTQNFQALEINAYIVECTLWYLSISEEWVKNGAIGDLQCADLPDFFKEDKDLSAQCEALQKATSTNDLIAVKEAFEIYLKMLHMLQDKAIAENVEYDLTTGLKNQATLEQDLKLEEERLARRGQAFSLAVMRIDGTADKSFQKAVAQNVKDCLRSFDDAYFSNDGLFVLSLKQTAMMGGEKAVERIRDAVEETSNGDISVSACVAEAQAEEKLAELLENISKDLKKHDTSKGAVFSFTELSPLQRLAQDQK